MKSQSGVFSSDVGALQMGLCGAPQYCWPFSSREKMAFSGFVMDQEHRLPGGTAPTPGCPGAAPLHANRPNLPVHIKGAQSPSGFRLWVSFQLSETAHTKMLTFHWALGLDLGRSQGKVHRGWERWRVRAC